MILLGVLASCGFTLTNHACATGQPALGLHMEPKITMLDPSRSKESPEARELKWAPPAQGFVVLCLVPVAWGTYGPAIKILYGLSAPPPELLFAMLNYIVSSSTLTLCSKLFQSPQGTQVSQAGSSSQAMSSSKPADSFAVFGLQVPRVALAGMELSAYLFVASLVQVHTLIFHQYTAAHFDAR